MMKGIAIIGMACRYPDANSPGELWENILAGRQAFRRIPGERLRLEDYLSTDRSDPDSIYCSQAALIKNYTFNRVQFKVAGDTYRTADLSHWLALDVASQALQDAGITDANPLQQETTGVYVGNTLTGEFSRASLMRLRWPYVNRVIESALIEEGLSVEQRAALLGRIEKSYKTPFTPMGEESLAGGLSNTIAGRICNHFDFKGGGYTIDGACASSLLAIITACSALENGEIDIAIAGGVDLSLDPFELVGFSRAGALAREKMRVFDTRSEGFWPGEGCGFVVLMRYEAALAEQRRVYAVIRGHGISSDGSGGLTRPEVEGQTLALKRAYRQAGYGIGSVTYFEAHATGTSVGDTVELKALSRSRRQDAPDEQPAFIGSIKANIGHTKAAAGVAGFIKTIMAVYTQVVPPTTGCEDPHPELTCDKPALKIVEQGGLWPDARPLRAGVSAMGFGGINTHITLEGVTNHRRVSLTEREKRLLISRQDAEVFLLVASDDKEIRDKLERLIAAADGLSQSELTDLAAALASQTEAHNQTTETTVRAATVATSPADLKSKLVALSSLLDDGVRRNVDIRSGIFIGTGSQRPRIGFLFPGQGSPSRRNGGAFRRRFEYVKEVYDRAALPAGGKDSSTAVAQPSIVTASLAGLRVLSRLGIEACAGIGHSLGEITALHWAGAIEEEALLRIAHARGRVMQEVIAPPGAMASVRLGAGEIKTLLNGSSITISGLNSPSQTVVSGESAAVSSFVELARSKGIAAVKLAVSHAFHSPLVASCAQQVGDILAKEGFNPLLRPIASTVTGDFLREDEDLRDLLCRQVTSPVRFIEAVNVALRDLDLLLEVGPGEVLTELVNGFAAIPALAVDAGGDSWRGLLKAFGAAFAMGAQVKPAALFEDRFARAFNLDSRPQFFINPCELAPLPSSESRLRITETQQVINDYAEMTPEPSPASSAGPAAGNDDRPAPIELLRQLIADSTELPLNTITDESRLLGHLHLNSIAVTQIIVEAARHLNLPVPVAPLDFSNVTLAQAAQTLEEAARLDSRDYRETKPLGVDSWVRVFTVKMIESPLSKIPARPASQGRWQVIASPDYPLKDLLEKAFNSRLSAGGVVVCLPPDPDEPIISLLLESARAVMSEDSPNRYILVQHGGGAASFARSLFLEMPDVETCVVDVPLNHPSAVDWVLQEADCAEGFVEAHYDEDGCRTEPRLVLFDGEAKIESVPVDSNDVLLISGGGKGIVAECAIALAKRTGAKLALLGRSDPDEDSELAGNLSRMRDKGISFDYLTVDITDKDAVNRAVSETQSRLGPITGILHGAGTNQPQLLSSLDEETFSRTLAPKQQGVCNLLAAIEPEKLKLFIAFGSLIARTGLRGEADYAVANEMLGRITSQWQAAHPDCLCLNIEWSVWAGVGMGQRLGVVDALARQGITPISIDQGVEILLNLLTCRPPCVSVVVTGRFAQSPTARFEHKDLPLLRFLEKPRVHYPGVEIVAEAELSADSDPYFSDHVYQGRRLFPAVMGLEAMAQVVKALVTGDESPILEDVKFDRPIILPADKPLTIRIAALARSRDRIEVAIRSDETGFQVDHFSAVCSFACGDDRTGEESRRRLIRPSDLDAASELALDPSRILYGKILFQTGRFKRVRSYRTLRAKQAVARIDSRDSVNWFARYLSAELTLGDPGARDAALHSIQASIPQSVLLPVGIDRLQIFSHEFSPVLLAASTQRSRHGDTFVYDMEITNEEGVVYERWTGLRLQRVSRTELPEQWPDELLGPYIERQIEDFSFEPSITVAIGRQAAASRQVRSNITIQQAIGGPARICRRPDGLPEIIEDGLLSASTAHAKDLTIAVAGPPPLACDAEFVSNRADTVWGDMLGADRFALARLITRETSEGLGRAATRVWVAGECMKKSGMMMNAPLMLENYAGDGWAIFSVGPAAIATFIASVCGFENQIAFGVLARRTDASL